VAITKLDILDTLDTVKVCVAYEVDGKRTTSLPYHQSDLHKAVPVYEELPGWKTDLTAVTERHQLPQAAADYLAFLEEQVGVPIRLVGTGPGREQFVHSRLLTDGFFTWRTPAKLSAHVLQTPGLRVPLG
jgi:adenylosuccinate synthase